MSRGAALLLGALTLLAACERGTGPRMWFALTTPHDEYAAQLERANLHTTALGRDWLAAAEHALAAPESIAVPHLETRYLDPSRATAVAYAVSLERGQRLVVGLEVADARPADIRLFVDLFYVAGGTAQPERVASADGAGWSFQYVALRPGRYVVRVQPELLRGGRATVSLRARASLAFPVAGADVAAIRSRFGAPRDAGRREHHGVDIFVSRGTPVVAAAAGRVTRVTSSRLGGNVVWLRDTAQGRSLYYAHLDRHAVLEDTWVMPGDTLGFVGNTGNARSTPPHLHFGVYLRPVGPVDPYFHLYDPSDEPAAFAGDTGLVGGWARIARAGAALRARPGRSAPSLAEADALTPLRVLGGSGAWYLARLPDGREGYVAVSDAQPLDPTVTVAVAAAAALRSAPAPHGGELDSIAPGEMVPVLGRFGGEVLVRRADGLQGWIPGGILSSSY